VPEPDPTLRVPFVDIELSAEVILAAAPSVLGFLVLTILGAMRATGQAVAALGVSDKAGAWEQLDIYPNAIDLAVYTTTKSPRWLATGLYFSYPTFLALAIVEAGAIWAQVIGAYSHLPTDVTILLLIAVPVIVAASWGLALAVVSRRRRVIKGTHVRPRQDGST
jgi:hypothetical protein